MKKTVLVSLFVMVAAACGKAFSLVEAGMNLKLRLVVRRDWPLPGQQSIVAVPFGYKSWETISASCAPDPNDAEVTRVTYIHHCHRLPRLTMAYKLIQELIRHHIKELTRVARIPGVEACASDTGYCIVSLRKCTKGPPLLPVYDGAGNATWVPAHRPDGSLLPLHEYLTAFLAAHGVSDTPLYGCFEGRRLVPYQAAVPEAAWRAVWPALQEPFRKQRSAYRSRNGGNCAPELSLGAAPRFVPGAFASMEQGPAPGQSAPEHIRGTFIQFSRDTKLRSLEAPF